MKKQLSNKRQPSLNEDGLVVTNNATGYMLEDPDEFMQMFFGYITELMQKNKKATVVDIGAAFGIATIELLKRGVTVIANDLELHHLKTLKAKTPTHLREKLVLQHAYFPLETAYSKNSIDAFLISRVFHFLSGELIEQALKLIYKSLITGGKLYISTMSPYLKFLESYISIYELKENNGEEWPGEITNLEKYLPPLFQGKLPNNFHIMTPTVLSRAIIKYGFKIKLSKYISRPRILPQSKLDGREYVIIIAEK